jgi:hypothetical protein
MNIFSNFIYLHDRRKKKTHTFKQKSSKNKFIFYAFVHCIKLKI